MTQPRNDGLSDHAQQALAYLEQVLFLQSQAAALEEKLKMAGMRSFSLPSSSDCSKAKVTHSLPEEAPFELAVRDKDQLEKELAGLLAQLEPLKEQAKRIIRKSTILLHRRIMLLHYIVGDPWALVAQLVSRTDRQVYRLRKEALEMITLPEDAIWL